MNVAAQRRDPNSLLNWMERIIRMRKEVPEIGWGDFSFLSTGNPQVLVMRYDWRDNAVVCVHNLARNPRKCASRCGCRKKKAGPSSTCFLKTTAIRAKAAATASCSSHTATAGSASAASTICSSESEAAKMKPGSGLGDPGLAFETWELAREK